jgi:hypothetical protein
MMSEQEIRNHILLSLSRLYENPLHRNQFRKFTFDHPSDEKPAKKIIANMVDRSIVEQTQPMVIRLTNLGYTLIEHEIAQLRLMSEGKAQIPEKPELLLPPTEYELKSISKFLEQPDYISASRIVEGKVEIFWATEGFQRVTGYTLEELKKAGGMLILLQGVDIPRKREELVKLLKQGNQISG